MKKFAQTADLGGAPIYKSDLAGTFNKEFWDVIEGLLYPIQLNTQGAIISGCTITDHSTTFDMTAGIVYLNGQYMRLSAVTGLSYPQYIQPDVAINDVRTFQNGNNITLEITQNAKYSSTIPGSGQYIAITTTGNLGNPGGFRIENYINAGTNASILTEQTARINGDAGRVLANATASSLGVDFNTLRTAMQTTIYYASALGPTNGWAANFDKYYSITITCDATQTYIGQVAIGLNTPHIYSRQSANGGVIWSAWQTIL